MRCTTFRSIDPRASGRGWLFKFDAAGQLLGRIQLTDGARYHPGGIDYDGRSIWVAVAEHRPNSSSNIYRVDPDTLDFELVLTVADHIGGIVHNTHRGTLHGVSWGSRRLYTWRLGGERVVSALGSDQAPTTSNPNARAADPSAVSCVAMA